MAGTTDALLGVAEQAGAGDSRTVASLIARLRSRHAEVARALLPVGTGPRGRPVAHRRGLRRARGAGPGPSPPARADSAHHRLPRLPRRATERPARCRRARGRPGRRRRYVDALDLIHTDGAFGRAAPDYRAHRPRDPADARAAAGARHRAGGARVHRRDTGRRGRDARPRRVGPDGDARWPERSARRGSRSGRTCPGCSPPIRGWCRTPGSSRSCTRARPPSSPTTAPRCCIPRALIPLARPANPRLRAAVRRPRRRRAPRSRSGWRAARFPVKALSAAGGQALVTVTGNGMLGVPGIAARTFAALHREQISVSLISQASSEHSICFSVPDAAGRGRAGEPRARVSAGDRARRDRRRRGRAGHGDDRGRRPRHARHARYRRRGLLARSRRASINVVAIAQGSSELNISVVVDAAQTGEAQRRIHAAFQLARIGGGARHPAGADGGRAARLRPDRTQPRRRSSGEVRRPALSLSRRGRHRPLRLRLRPAGAERRDGSPSLAAEKRKGRRLAERRRGRARHGRRGRARTSRATRLPGRCWWTSPRTIPRRGARAGADPRHGPGARQQACRSPGRRADQRVALADRAGARDGGVLHEATVGAGLPIIDTYHKLIESGDRVERIEGLLSGTLGFVLSEISAGTAFSAAVRTRDEPGLHRARPARRPLGHGRRAQGAHPRAAARLSRRAVARRPSNRSCPSGRAGFRCRSSSSGCAELDAGWRAPRARRRARSGTVLRYVATVTPAKIAVGLRAVPSTSPVGRHQGLGQPARVHHRALPRQSARDHRARRRRRSDRGRRAERHPPAGGRVMASGLGDRVRARRRRQRRARASTSSVSPSTGAGDDGTRRVVPTRRAFTMLDPGHPELPSDPARHTAALAAPRGARAPRARELGRGRGIALSVRKGLPLCRRTGRQRRLGGGRRRGGQRAPGRAARRVTALLGAVPRRGGDRGGSPPRQHRPLAARWHRPDPLASTRSTWSSCRCPTSCVVVLVRPDQRDAHSGGPRRCCRVTVPRDVALHQAAQVGAMVAALASADFALARRARSTTASPSPCARRLLPGFAEAKAAALAAGALGSSISGSGPTAFALARGDEVAARIARGDGRGLRGARASAAAARMAPVDRRGRPACSRRREECAMRFETDPSARAGRCASPAATSDRARSRTHGAPRAAGCSRSGTVHPTLTARRAAPSASPSAGASARARRRRVSGGSARSSSPAATDSGVPPRRQHAAAPPRGARPLDRHADRLLLKHEGHNPTGSFKDRGMTVGVTQARRIGATAVACASTGNTSASLAAYAAQAGCRRWCSCRRGRSPWASWRRRWPTARARCWSAATSTTACAWSRRRAQRLGVYLLNSINPFRIEGQKTIVLEMLQQLGWEPPDWIVLPAGNLGNTAAFGKALQEAQALGLITRMPRLAGGAGRGRGAVRAQLPEEFATRHTREGGDGGDGDPDRRPGLVRSGACRDPGDQRRRARP